jgi:hypothetical protein
MAASASPTPALAGQVRRLGHGYVRHGAKANRRRPLGRAVAAVEWAAARERITGLDQIGKRHVVDFWKAHRHLADSTAYAYWLALRELWGGWAALASRQAPGQGMAALDLGSCDACAGCGL